ncbi:MAG TPA: serine/threonine-protein kinase [Pyrinomonadaceae bacterium]|jgi:serine/threonine-protein kinase|nr:serine/threonine-protein kinase [Pyrinomonadaceae bacterium]
MIGQIIGNYKIEEKLGEGGMGAVYKGVDTMLDREVAIKALRPELASQDSIVERFRTEAVTLAKLNHPNIATLYSLFRQGEELYMVLEFVRGETLDSIMKSRGALPAEEAIPVFCQVLDGIDHAHELGIVHRDIKPANMMLTEKGTLKVLDFGIARLLGSARMTRAGNIIGTLEYMAPEQVRGQETDGRSDIYALGMMLYEVLTGRLPFESENEFELMKMQTEVTPPPPREINPAIPEEVEEAIMRAIRKDPEERFQTAGDFREMLQEAGLGTDAVIHGATGTFRRSSTRPSHPPISKPVAVLTEPANTGGMKETRLAGAAGVATAPPVMQPTRVVTSPAAAAAAIATAPESPSFFSKLGVVHYAAAGGVLLLLIGVVIAVPLFLLSGGKGAANTDTKKDTNSQKPDVVTIQQPQQQPLAPPPSQPSEQQPVAAGAGELTPIEPAGKNDRTETRTDRPAAPAQRNQPAPRTVAQQPPPQQAPPPQPAQTPKKESKLKKALKLLTGN